MVHMSSGPIPQRTTTPNIDAHPRYRRAAADGSRRVAIARSERGATSSHLQVLEIVQLHQRATQSVGLQRNSNDHALRLVGFSASDRPAGAARRKHELGRVLVAVEPSRARHTVPLQCTARAHLAQLAAALAFGAPAACGRSILGCEVRVGFGATVRERSKRVFVEGGAGAAGRGGGRVRCSKARRKTSHSPGSNQHLTHQVTPHHL